jgi:uncharacterized protein YjlB
MHREALHLDTPGWSNPGLPVLLYRGALAETADPAAAFEALFGRNGWPAQWRNGVYTFHHYHANAHEVLGFAAGSARLILGGPDGKEVSISAGDAVLLPAGTGHFQVAADPELLVIGAYPPDQQNFDTHRRPASAEATETFNRLPCPATDPITGLTNFWPA